MKLMKKAKRAGRFHLLTAAVFLVVLSVWSPVFADEADVLEPIEVMEVDAGVENAVPVEAGAEVDALMEAAEVEVEDTPAVPTEVEVVETEVEAEFDDIISMGADGYIIICKNDKIGLLDRGGQIILPCEYDNDEYNFYILSYYGSYFENNQSLMLRMDGKYAVISTAGEPLSLFKYDNFLPQYSEWEEDDDIYYTFTKAFNQSGIAIVQEKGKGWGIVNSQGEEVVMPQYSRISEFVNGRAAANRFDLYGFIDEEGNEIIDCQYERVSGFANGYAVVESRGGYGIIDENGKTIIQPVYDKVYNFNEDGLACIVLGDETSFVDKGGNVKFSLPSGVVLGEHYYYFNSDGLEFSDGLLPVAKKVEDLEESDNSYYRYYGYYGYYYYDDDYYDYKYGYIDDNGNIAISLEYDAARPFQDGLAVVSKDGLYGIINKSGDMVVECQYEYLWHDEDGFTAIGEDDTYHIINLDGELIIDNLIDPEDLWGGYDDQYYWSGDYFGIPGYYIFEDDKEGFMSEDGEVLVPVEYEYVFVEDERFAIVTQDGLDGIYDMEQKAEIIPCQYIWLAVDQLDDGTPVFLAYKDQKRGVLSIDGEVLIPFIYSDFELFNGTSIAVGQGEDGLYRYIDINNQVVIPGEFKFAGAFTENKALVQKLDGKWYTLELVQDAEEVDDAEEAEEAVEEEVEEAEDTAE